MNNSNNNNNNYNNHTNNGNNNSAFHNTPMTNSLRTNQGHKSTPSLAAAAATVAVDANSGMNSGSPGVNCAAARTLLNAEDERLLRDWSLLSLDSGTGQ